MFAFGRAEAAQRALLDLQHKGRRQRTVGIEEVEAAAEHLGVAQGDARDVAEQADVLVAHQKPAQHLHAAQQDGLVDPRHRAGFFRDLDEVGRGDDVVVAIADPRHCLIVAHLALRQRDHRLQMQVDAIGIDRVLDRSDNARVIDGGDRLRRRNRGHGRCGRPDLAARNRHGRRRPLDFLGNHGRRRLERDGGLRSRDLAAGALVLRPLLPRSYPDSEVPRALRPRPQAASSDFRVR